MESRSEPRGDSTSAPVASLLASIETMENPDVNFVLGVLKRAAHRLDVQAASASARSAQLDQKATDLETKSSELRLREQLLGKHPATPKSDSSSPAPKNTNITRQCVVDQKNIRASFLAAEDSIIVRFQTLHHAVDTSFTLVSKEIYNAFDRVKHIVYALKQQQADPNARGQDSFHWDGTTSQAGAVEFAESNVRKHIDTTKERLAATIDETEETIARDVNKLRTEITQQTAHFVDVDPASAAEVKDIHNAVTKLSDKTDSGFEILNAELIKLRQPLSVIRGDLLQQVAASKAECARLQARLERMHRSTEQGFLKVAVKAFGSDVAFLGEALPADWEKAATFPLDEIELSSPLPKYEAYCSEQARRVLEERNAAASAALDQSMAALIDDIATFGPGDDKTDETNLDRTTSNTNTINKAFAWEPPASDGDSVTGCSLPELRPSSSPLRLTIINQELRCIDELLATPQIPVEGWLAVSAGLTPLREEGEEADEHRDEKCVVRSQDSSISIIEKRAIRNMSSPSTAESRKAAVTDWLKRPTLEGGLGPTSLEAVAKQIEQTKRDTFDWLFGDCIQPEKVSIDILDLLVCRELFFLCGNHEAFPRCDDLVTAFTKVGGARGMPVDEQKKWRPRSDMKLLFGFNLKNTISASCMKTIESLDVTPISGEIVAQDVFTADAPTNLDSDSDFDRTLRSLAPTPASTDSDDEGRVIVISKNNEQLLSPALIVDDESSNQAALVTALTTKMKTLDK
ncbi:hypothetical protein B0T14DRAFT_605778 [Immersiella caudata]|uniref:Uncharacterized protein n=1 Tax=Immersiella caudata TaxID=314043 RepID=A0AA39TQD5_9PEZI|nr:hypothetical protein B0T14DRAFT_605778 [Immersiella caudata]